MKARAVGPKKKGSRGRGVERRRVRLCCVSDACPCAAVCTRKRKGEKRDGRKERERARGSLLVETSSTLRTAESQPGGGPTARPSANKSRCSNHHPPSQTRNQRIPSCIKSKHASEAVLPRSKRAGESGVRTNEVTVRREGKGGGKPCSLCTGYEEKCKEVCSVSVFVLYVVVVVVSNPSNSHHHPHDDGHSNSHPLLRSSDTSSHPRSTTSPTRSRSRTTPSLDRFPSTSTPTFRSRPSSRSSSNSSSTSSIIQRRKERPSLSRQRD